MDAFSKYNNLLAMTVGNEVITEEANTTAAAPYVKAAIRDIKAFRDAPGYREIPVAYGAADVQSMRLTQAEYFACGDTSDTIDMYGMNVYSWCGNSSYHASGFDKLYEEFESMNIPLLFSETGCKSEGRDFSDVATMLGPVFQAIFSGSVVPYFLQRHQPARRWQSTRPRTPRRLVQPRPSQSGLSMATFRYRRLQISTSTRSRRAPLLPAGRQLSVEPPRGRPLRPVLEPWELQVPLVFLSRRLASPGLSTAGVAGVAGVAVGSGVGGLAVIGTAIFLFWRRRAARKGQREEDELNQAPMLPPCEDDDGTHRFKSELPANSVARVIPRQELEADRGSQGVTEYYGRPGWKQAMSGSEVEGTTPVRPQSRAYEMEGTIPEPRELQ
ncbi:putative 1,3-beta-glucanosyltransferase [Seiridium unicorne]|uniref:1,3-beta-glucanosyltransferase n=1 Tax=Seiridium unicorne TaxID=138068 RepID=A0ABR2UT71_9PEZI